MDGITESIIVVIGSPIAGNPSQFAVERALRWLHLDWRVLSFDVAPKDVAAALEGFSVTGIVGVLIDPTVQSAASRWYADRIASIETTRVGERDDETSGEEPLNDVVLIDCLYRDSQQEFVGSCEQRAWVDKRIAQHGGQQRLWIGDETSDTPVKRAQFDLQPTPGPPDPDLVAQADLIFLAEQSGSPVELEIGDWPADDGSTLVVDLTKGHPDRPNIRRLGYGVVSRLDRRIGTIQRRIERWTGQTPAREVIQDAIEEYLGF